MKLDYVHRVKSIGSAIVPFLTGVRAYFNARRAHRAARLHYDGTAFADGSDSPLATVQGESNALCRALRRSGHSSGAGRTDAGVHARGQAVGVRVPEKWRALGLRRALNALLPADIWVAEAHEMRSEFHARYSAQARRYTYYVGTDEGAKSPFRRRTEWAFRKSIDRDALQSSAEAIRGDHCFIGFAVRGTAPATDNHRCTVTSATWREREGGLQFEIEANRFSTTWCDFWSER